jgi:hypothetical protein
MLKIKKGQEKGALRPGVEFETLPPCTIRSITERGGNIMV